MKSGNANACLFLLIYQFYRNDVTKRRNVNVTRSLAETYSQGRKWSRNGCSFFLLSPHTRCVTRSGRLGVTAPLYLPDSHRIILEVSNKMVARRCAEHRSSFLSIDREFSRLVSTIHFRQIFSIERIEKYTWKIDFVQIVSPWMIIRVQLYIYLHLTARPIIHIELLIRRITFPLQENRTVSLLLCLSILLATIHNGEYFVIDQI